MVLSRADALAKPMLELDLASAAYIAGLVDGEGTVTLTRLHRHEQRRLVLTISNNELPLLTFVRDAVGAGRITGKRTYSVRHAPSYTYQITSRQALSLLRQILPLMRSYKVHRASLAIEHYVALTPRNGRYTGDRLARRKEFEEGFLAIRYSRKR